MISFENPMKNKKTGEEKVLINLNWKWQKPKCESLKPKHQNEIWRRQHSELPSPSIEPREHGHRVHHRERERERVTYSKLKLKWQWNARKFRANLKKFWSRATWPWNDTEMHAKCTSKWSLAGVHGGTGWAGGDGKVGMTGFEEKRGWVEPVDCRGFEWDYKVELKEVVWDPPTRSWHVYRG